MVVKENIGEDDGLGCGARNAVVLACRRLGASLAQTVNRTLDRAKNPWLRCIKREQSARRASGRLMGGVA